MNKTCYEDGLVRAELVFPAANKGHLFITPQKDISSIEELEDITRDHLFFTSSYVATLLFELVKAHGTNIILNELDQPFGIHVIARYQDDGLNFLWEPQRGDQEKLQEMGKKIKDAADEIAWARDNKDGKSQNFSTESIARKENNSTHNANSKNNNNHNNILDLDDPDQKDNHLLDIFRRVP